MTTVDAPIDFEPTHTLSSGVAMIPKDYDRDQDSFEEITEGMRSGFHSFYNSHLRFLLLLLTVLVVSPLLVYGGIQVIHSHPPQILEALVTTSGVQMMSTQELTVSVAAEKRTVYWLGPITGDKYIDNIAKTGIDQISYLPENSTRPDSGQFDLRVTTYGNQDIYKAQPHLAAGGAEKTVTNAFGTKVQYDPALPNRTIVQFGSKPEIVVIDYPTFQSESSLIDTAQTLAKIG